MKPFYLSTSVLLFTALIQTACASERIIEVLTKREIAREELVEKMALVDEVVVGEKHDTASIQNSEAKLFADFARVKRERVTFAWEFFNWSEKAKIDEAYAKFSDEKLSSDEFLKAVFGEKSPNLTYAPLMDVVKAAGADLLATNLTREEKAPVSKAGIGALDPKLLPPGFEVGGSAYYDRFVEAMGGHGDPAKLPNYFAAQSLVDDVVALHLAGDRSTQSVFLVIGEFHSRYFDGVWKRLEKRSNAKTRMLVQIANPSDESDWSLVLNHPKFGPLADYLILTD